MGISIIKIYNKNHVILDELVKFSALSYVHTLNGIGNMQFSIGIEDTKATPENLQFFNHVEVWKDGTLQWGGIIVSRAFKGSAISVGCYGHAYKLKKRRLTAQTYATQTYGALINTMLTATNAISETGITAGTIENGALETTRKVENTDYMWDKAIEFVDDGNYNIEVTDDRLLNFYLSKGSLKTNYILEYGGRNDNIISDPGLEVMVSDMANSIYSEITGLTSSANDAQSQELYGLIEGTYSASSSIVYQSTLDAYVTAELQRLSNPLNSLSVSIKDTARCPFDDIAVGDTIPISLIPYWGFAANVRILEIKHNEDTGIRDLTVGNVIRRETPPNKKIYKG